MNSAPSITSETTRDGVRVALAGGWTIDVSPKAERAAARILEAAKGAQRATIDLAGIEQLDTAGAWIIDRARVRLADAGTTAAYASARPEQRTLLREAHYRVFETPGRRHPPTLRTVLADIGESVSEAGKDLVNGLNFLGHVIAAMASLSLRPLSWRITSLVFHLEAFGLRSVPIIVLITFLVGCIVAQQGIFQLQRFGAATFAVDLIGILVLRELGVLLTAIMIAGRSGSAITAEIGSMKMREEIDAMHVMAVDPIEALIVPRTLALLIAMPLLTFLADMSAIFGGMVVAWIYGDISPDVYFQRLQAAIGLNTFLVGLIKAPFMALAIALIASVEGFAVEGSAESLGRKVTNAVVKSIFMVIAVDGLFAIYFAAIRF